MAGLEMDLFDRRYKHTIPFVYYRLLIVLAIASGVMSVFSGIVIFFLLPASPEKLGRGFTAAEKEIALRRYREGYNVEGDTNVRGSQILKVLKDPHSWMYSMSPSLEAPCCCRVNDILWQLPYSAARTSVSQLSGTSSRSSQRNSGFRPSIPA